MMRFTVSHVSHSTLLRIVGIAFAAITVLAEIVSLVFLIFASQQPPPVVFLYFALSIVVGVFICLLWLEFPPPIHILRRKVSRLVQLQEPSPVPIDMQVRAFTVAREDAVVQMAEEMHVEEGADKYAWKIHETHDASFRCALADGVSTSFLPARWAQIIVDRYVSSVGDMHDARQQAAWLRACSREWHLWLTNVWIPRMNQLHERQRNWQNERTRGAQTTLVACSLSTQQLMTEKTVPIHILAIGDTNLFLLQPSQDEAAQWVYQAFPLEHRTDFGVMTDALTTSEVDIEETIPYIKSATYSVRRGDYLLLATDALAKWILARVEKGDAPWAMLLAIDTEEAFRHFVQCEREAELDLDDTTLMLVSLV